MLPIQSKGFTSPFLYDICLSFLPCWNVDAQGHEIIQGKPVLTVVGCMQTTLQAPSLSHGANSQDDEKTVKTCLGIYFSHLSPFFMVVPYLHHQNIKPWHSVLSLLSHTVSQIAAYVIYTPNSHVRLIRRLGCSSWEQIPSRCLIGAPGGNIPGVPACCAVRERWLFFHWNILDAQHCVNLRYTTRRSDTFIHYNVADVSTAPLPGHIIIFTFLGLG